MPPQFHFGNEVQDLNDGPSLDQEQKILTLKSCLMGNRLVVLLAQLSVNLLQYYPILCVLVATSNYVTHGAAVALWPCWFPLGVSIIHFAILCHIGEFTAHKHHSAHGPRHSMTRLWLPEFGLGYGPGLGMFTPIWCWDTGKYIGWGWAVCEVCCCLCSAPIACHSS